MFLHFVATVRPTETWTAFHFVAVLVAILVVVLLVRFIRVRRRR